MNKFSVLSLASLVIFIVLYYVMMSGVSFGIFGKAFIFTMFLLPILGFLSGLKAKNGLMKWILIILNFVVFCMVVYISLLAYGIPER